MRSSIPKGSGYIEELKIENERLKLELEKISAEYQLCLGNKHPGESVSEGKEVFASAKKTEDALKVEHDILEAVINNMGVGFVVSDPAGNITSMNKAALKIHDFKTEAESLSNLQEYMKEFRLEETDGKEIPPSYWPLSLALRNEYVRDYQVRLIHDNYKSPKIVSYNTVPIYDSGGALMYIVLTMTDHTEIKLRTEALNESEQRYYSLFNNNTMGIVHCKIITDIKGRPADYQIIRINDAYTAITGIKKEDIEGRTATEVFPVIEKYSFDSIGQYGKIALEGGELNIERYSEALGLWLSIYVYSAKKGEFTAMFTDISKRKLAEEDAIASEQRLKGIFNDVAIGIIEVDQQNRITSVNKRACWMLGYSDEELSGKSITEITWPEDRKITDEKIASLIQGEYDIYDYEKRYIKKDGTPLWAHVTVSAVRNSKGQHTNSIGTFEDISERKKVEDEHRKAVDALKKNETILKQAGIMANLGAWETEFIHPENFSKNPLHWSDQVFSIFGYNPGSVPITTELFYDHVHPDDRKAVRDAIARAIVDKKPYTIEHRILRKDGIERKVVEHAEISYDMSGEPLRIIGAVQDITERKLEEERLHEALKQAEEGRNILTALMENIPVGLSIADAHYAKIRMISRYGMDLLDITADKLDELPSPGHLLLYGAFHADGITPATADELPLTRAIMNGEVVKNEEWIVKRKNGDMVPILCNAAPVLDKKGNILGGVLGWQDIAERRRALKALEESEEKFRSLFENITEGVAIHEVVYKKGKPADYKILDINPAFTEHTGISKLDAKGAFASKLYNAVIPPYLDEFSEVAVTGKPLRFDTFYPPMNRHFIISVISPKKNQFATVFEDVTEQKKNEYEIKQKNEELTRFIYTVSHDLKSPLVTIKSFTSYLREDIDNQDKEAQEKDLNYIENAADKMGKLLDELLELSRIGRKEQPKTKFTLKSVAQSAIDLVAGRIARQKVKIKFTGPSVLLHGHQQRLIQLYQNLIDNAVKFMGDEPAPIVEIGSFIDKERNNEVVLFVRDNGIGIDPRYHHKLFGLFEKMDNKTEGTGIGLALIKRITEVHGGTIWFESDGPGKGTTFYFTLEGTKVVN
jgi:PAS domain S-box-containing protein